MRFYTYKHLVLLLLLGSSLSAQGSIGSFLNGAGANNRALSGAGVAFAEDGMVMAVNPAGLISLEEDGLQLGVTLLTTKQTTEASAVDLSTAPPGAFAIAPGKREAEPDVPAEIDGVFPVPFGAYHRRLDEDNAVGVVVYGNGGININYKAFANPACPPGTPGQGYFCFGDAGSDIAQLFVVPTWSHRVNSRLNVGVGAALIYQAIEITGLQLFSPMSARPDRLSNNGHSNAFGYGLKLGATFAATERLNLGLSLQSRGHMNEHSEYAGLLPEQGDLDVPPTLQFGLAWQANDAATVLVDFQRIYFSKINALANPGDAPGRYGDDNGPGFGWKDAAALKVGLHLQASQRLTLRFGVTDVVRAPLPNRELVSNLISSGIFDEHFNAGLSWKLSGAGVLDLSLNYAPKQRESVDNPRFPGQRVTLSNEIFSVDLGWRKAI